MIPSVAADAGLAGAKYLGAQGQAFVDDPIGYFISITRKLGAVFAVAGTGMGIAAYFLKAAATTAMNNDLQVLGNIGAIFSNIQAPSFTPAATGTAPITPSVQGVQNFFGDAWADAQGAGADVASIGGAMGTLAEDVPTAIIDLAKSTLAFTMHFPDLLWNGAVYAIGGGVADILTWAFPWLLIIGGALLAASLIASGVRYLWGATVGPAWRESYAEASARLQTRIKGRFDRLLRNHHPSPIPEPRRPFDTPEDTSPVPGPENPVVTPPGASFSASEAPEQLDSPESLKSALVAEGSLPNPEKPLPAGWTEAEVEYYLGKAQEAARDARVAAPP